MIDEIIKNNGASRLLKTVPRNDAPGSSPTDFSSFMDMLERGTFPVDICYPTSSPTTGIYQEGTKLNKENLLSSAAESAIWNTSVPSTPTPSLAFQNLGDRMKSTESSVSSALSSISSLDGRMNSAETSISSALSSISSLDGQMNSAESSINTLSNTKLNKAGDTITGGLTFANSSRNILGGMLAAGWTNEIVIKTNDGSGFGDLSCENISTGSIQATNIELRGGSSNQIIGLDDPSRLDEAVNLHYFNNHNISPLKLSCYYSFSEVQVTSHSDTSYSIIKNAVQGGSLVILNVEYEAKGTPPVVQGDAIFTNVYMDKDGVIKFYGRVYNDTQTEDITISIYPDGTWY